MNDIIHLPESAARADFAQFVGEGEVNASLSESSNGGLRFEAAAELDIIGHRIVRFERAYESLPVQPGMRRRPGNKGAFIGWRKIVTQYVVESTGTVFGDTFGDKPESRRCYYYVREG